MTKPINMTKVKCLKYSCL